MSIRTKLIVNQELFRNVIAQNPNSNEMYVLVLSAVLLWLYLARGHLIVNSHSYHF